MIHPRIFFCLPSCCLILLSTMSPTFTFCFYLCPFICLRMEGNASFTHFQEWHCTQRWLPIHSLSVTCSLPLRIM
jgi:hypothetical protein